MATLQVPGRESSEARHSVSLSRAETLVEGERDAAALRDAPDADHTAEQDATHGIAATAAGKGGPLPSEAQDRDVEAAMSSTDLEGAAPSPSATGHQKKAVPELQDQTNLLPFKQLIVVFIGLSIAIFVSLLDQTIVSTAIPQIAADFSSGQQAEWVGTSYLVTSTVFQPIYGRVSDIFGRKFVLLFTLVIFAVGSVLCAVAQTMIQIAFRAITGIGGGGIITLVMIIISDVVALKERGKYQGITGGVVALGNSIGPVIGGLFAAKASWRWCFWLGVPLSGIALLVVIFLLPLRRVKGDIKTKLKQVDYLGTVLSLLGTMGILIPLSWGGTTFAWSSVAVVVPLVLGSVLLIAFLIVEWKFAAIPNIPLDMFKNRTVCGVQISTFLSGCIFYVQLYYLPQYFQVVKGFTAIQSGVQLLPLIVVQTFFSFSSGMIVTLTGEYRINIYLGFAIWTIGLGLLSTLTHSSTLAQQVGYLVLTGIGAGQTFQTTLIAAQAAVPRNQMAVVTGTRNFLRMLGGTVALAVCQAILNNTVQTRLTQASFSPALISSITSEPTSYNQLNLSASQILTVQDAYNVGVQNVFRFCYPCSIVAFFVTLLMIKQYSLKRGDEEELKAKGKEWAERHEHHHHHHEKPSGRNSGTASPALQEPEKAAEVTPPTQ